MRRTMAILIAVISAAAAFAQEPDDEFVVPTVSLGWNAGVHYHAIPEGINLQYFRIGGGLDVQVNFTDMLGSSFEAGILYGQYKDDLLSDPVADVVFDFPLRLTLLARFDGIVVQPMLGFYSSGYGANSEDPNAPTEFNFTNGFEVGSRLAIGDSSYLGLEITRVYLDSSFTRVGVFVRGGLLNL